MYLQLFSIVFTSAFTAYFVGKIEKIKVSKMYCDIHEIVQDEKNMELLKSQQSGAGGANKDLRWVLISTKCFAVQR